MKNQVAKKGDEKSDAREGLVAKEQEAKLP